MLGVTPRFLAGLGTARWVVRCEWSRDNGLSWTPCTYVDGTVTADAGQQTRWSTDGLVVRDLPVGRQAFAPFGSWIRLFSGLVLGPGEVEWCPLGVYLAQSMDRSSTDPDEWTITGKSLEQVVIDDRFPSPRSIPAQEASVTGPALIRESVPTAQVLWRCDDVTLPGITEERDRWGVIDGRPDASSIAKSLGARCYCDARGVFIFADEASLSDDPVYTFDVGEGGNLVDAAESISSEATYNAISVSGVSNDSKRPPVGPVYYADTDQSSPTWIGLRRKVKFYASPKIRVIAQADKVAVAQLATSLGMAQQVTLTSAYNPALEVGDVLLARMPDKSMQRHIGDRISYDPRGGTMKIDSRAATTALAGQPVDAATLVGDVQIAAPAEDGGTGG